MELFARAFVAAMLSFAAAVTIVATAMMVFEVSKPPTVRASTVHMGHAR